MTDQTMWLHGRPVTREALVRFKAAYVSAVERGDKVFEFDGQVVLVAYAKFVVEYAESQLGPLDG